MYQGTALAGPLKRFIAVIPSGFSREGSATAFQQASFSRADEPATPLFRLAEWDLTTPRRQDFHPRTLLSRFWGGRDYLRNDRPSFAC